MRLARVAQAWLARGLGASGRACRRWCEPWLGAGRRRRDRWRSPYLRLVIGRDAVRAEVVRRGAVAWAGEAPFTDPADLSAAVAELAAEPVCARAGRRTVAEWRGGHMQVRTLHDLPPVAVPALRLLVAQHVTRFFRLSPDPLLTDAIWLPRKADPAAPRRAQAVALATPWVEQLEAGALAAGLRLRRVGPAPDAADPRLEFRSPRSLARAAERARREVRVLLTVALMLPVLVGAMAMRKLDREHAALLREEARLRRPAAAVLTVRQAMRDARAMVEAVDASVPDRGRITRTLAALTSALPDSAYLTSLGFDSAGGVLTGVAPRAAEVLAALDRDDAVVDPRLEGPAVRELLGGRERERFTIRFGAP
ncbi:MAG TPA: PilN domain-containing protein [Gemmatimonadales bacterium]|nr:PilN domain-containing protein [Gemmatimonadales bacterium]